MAESFDIWYVASPCEPLQMCLYDAPDVKIDPASGVGIGVTSSNIGTKKVELFRWENYSDDRSSAIVALSFNITFTVGHWCFTNSTCFVLFYCQDVFFTIFSGIYFRNTVKG